MQRAVLTTLLTSFGVPMLLGGDELGRTQQGNNNAYCQDTPLAWFDWETADTGLLDFTRRLIRLRREHPALRRSRFLTGIDTGQVSWFTPAGTPMTPANWDDPNARAIMIHLDGREAPDTAPDGTAAARRRPARLRERLVGAAGHGDPGRAAGGPVDTTDRFERPHGRGVRGATCARRAADLRRLPDSRGQVYRPAARSEILVAVEPLDAVV